MNFKAHDQIAVLMAECERAAKEGDDERAHSKEDALRELALKTIFKSEDLDEIKKIAKFALKTKKLEFSRWCA